MDERWGGENSYIVPFTADYDIELSGSQGSCYSGVSGGYGYKLSKKVRLQYGDILKIDTPNHPASSVTSTGGNAAKLYVNGTLVWVAGGGTGHVPRYDDSDKNVTTSTALTIAGGKGSPNGSNGSITFHTDDESKPGQCYNKVAHTHSAAKGCPGHQCGSSGGCGHSTDVGSGIEGGGGEGAYCHATVWTCSKQWDYPKKCGKNNGTVIAKTDATAGTCSNAGGVWEVTQSTGNSSNAKFSISLHQQSNLWYGSTVSLPKYQDRVCNLILKDNVVVHFKRW